MMVSKLKIKHNFDKASDSYENVANMQKESARILARKLLDFDSHFYPNKILELGGGTGYVAESLLEHYAPSSYTLNDISPKMLEKARNKFINHDNFIYCLGDMETIAFEHHPLIISNLVFQWAHDLWGLLQKIYKKCEILAFSCLLNGTLSEWQNILNGYGLAAVVQHYPMKNEMIRLLSKLSGNRDLSFYFQDFHLQFTSLYRFLKYLNALGAGMSNVTIPTALLRSLIKQHDKTFCVTYKLFYAIVRR